MAGRVVSKYYSEIIWRQNQTSVNNIKKSTANIAKSLENTRVNSAKRVAKAEQWYQDQTEKANMKRINKEVKRDMDVFKVRKNQLAAEQKIRSALAKESQKDFNAAVKNITAPTGAGGMASYYRQQEKAANAQAKAADKQNQAINNARIRQAVGNITAPTGAENMRSYYKNLEKQSSAGSKPDNTARKQVQFEERRLKAVEALEYRLRSVNGIEKETLLNQIRQVKTQDELNRAKATTRMRAAQILDAQRQIEREMNKQNFLQERMNGSILQMAGGFVSAYAALEGIKRVIGTGIDWEGIQRSFQVVDAIEMGTPLGAEGSLKKAGDDMNYVAVRARELGLPLRDAQKGYLSLVAAMNTKLPTNDIRTIFEGINEAGVALGVGEEGIQRITLAVKQMALI